MLLSVYHVSTAETHHCMYDIDVNSDSLQVLSDGLSMPRDTNEAAMGPYWKLRGPHLRWFVGISQSDLDRNWPSLLIQTQ